MAQSGCEDSVDLFRISFKKYKSVKSFEALFPTPQPSSKNCVNGEKQEEVMILDLPEGDLQQKRSLSERNLNLNGICQCSLSRFGLRPPNTWKAYELCFPEGLILIRNPFTSEGQRYWVQRSVIDFPNKPFITNIDNLENKIKAFKAKLNMDEFYQKLRWVTFGYHHNWDTKIYSEDNKSEFPQDLADLTNFMAKVLGFSEFKAEAAIANYYHLDSTLSGHVDRSEANQSAPLFSLSFGQPAVFLIGGRSKSIKPQAVLLRSGDIAVMSGQSRLSYHGVPKVVHSPETPWNSNESFVIITSSDDDTENGISKVKKAKLEIDSSSSNHPKTEKTLLNKSDSLTCKEANCTYPEQGGQEKQNLDISEADWSPFLKDYVSKSRINLNIRQVLFPGQTKLSHQES